MKWRIIKNTWNLRGAPWRDAVGIEEDDDTTAVPAVVCWFTRDLIEPLAIAQSVVDEHNRSELHASATPKVPIATVSGAGTTFTTGVLAATYSPPAFSNAPEGDQLQGVSRYEMAHHQKHMER